MSALGELRARRLRLVRAQLAESDWLHRRHAEQLRERDAAIRALAGEPERDPKPRRFERRKGRAA